MSLYKYNITVKVDDEDDKYNNLSNENNYIMSFLLRGGYIG